MEKNLTNLTIGMLAKEAGVSVETIRFYQRKGLLSKPDRPYGGVSHYGIESVTRLKFVKSVQNLDFSLDEVSILLRMEDGYCCEEVQMLTKKKIENIRKKIINLRNIESYLVKILKNCCSENGRKSCPLVKHS